MPETRPALRAEAGNGQIQALQAEKKQGSKLVLTDIWRSQKMLWYLKKWLTLLTM